MVNLHGVSDGQTPMSLKARLTNFFFAEEAPFGLAIVRICIGVACLLVTVPRWIHSRELYSSDGAPTPLALNYGYPDLLPVPDGAVAVALMTILTFCCVTACIGWCTRISLSIAAVLYTYLNLLDSISTMTKYSVITSHVLFLLAFSHCGAVWSVDAWLRRRRLGLPAPRCLADHPQFPAWPRRLIQILIGVVYFGASVTKMHTPAYFSGDQLWHWMMSNVNNANPVGEWLTLYPAVLVVFAYLCFVWEILFLFLAWRGWGRICMITMGVVFHVMTTLTLGLYLFPITCISIYFAFTNSADVVYWASRWRRWKRQGRETWCRWATTATRWPRMIGRQVTNRLQPLAERATPVASLGTFTVLLSVVAWGAVEVEYQIDPYGERHPDGKFTLREIDPQVAKRMFAGDVRLRDYDKLLAFDIGTSMFGGMVTGKKDVFRHGEAIIAQCSLSPPHEDMWVECNLHDASNVVVDRVGQVVVRSQLRCSFLYRACEALEPGVYYLALKFGGKEVTRRKIEILASDAKCRALAN
jgi:hypothetical protein